eukprot:UN24606
MSNTFMCWNLITGKSIFKKKMPKKAVAVMWSPSGKLYCIQRLNKALVYDQEGDLISVLKHDKGICNVTFVNDDVLVAGSQDEKFLVMEYRT